MLCRREHADEAKLIVITLAENGVIVIARLNRVPEAQRNLHNKARDKKSLNALKMFDLFIKRLRREEQRCDCRGAGC